MRDLLMMKFRRRSAIDPPVKARAALAGSHRRISHLLLAERCSCRTCPAVRTPTVRVGGGRSAPRDAIPQSA